MMRRSPTAEASRGNQGLPASREGDDNTAGGVRFFFIFFHVSNLFYLRREMQPKDATDPLSEQSGRFDNILS
jgi:hypothetical protein